MKKFFETLTDTRQQVKVRCNFDDDCLEKVMGSIHA